MLCQNCGKNAATNYVHSVVNGVVKDKYLCSECATKQKINSLYNDDFFKMFSAFFGNETVERPSKVCKVCGTTFSDIKNTGRLGCGDCYKTFYDELLPTLKNVHGNINHIGNRPDTVVSKAVADNNTAEIKSELQILKEDLKKAIENEEYEKAAVLRDEIKNKEGQ